MNQTSRVDAAIISPIAPSGASWLYNALVALNVHAFPKDEGQPPLWVKSASGEYTLASNFDEAFRWLPVLMERTTFPFGDSPKVEWSHAWPYANVPAKVIYVERDAKDALYSLYRKGLPIGLTNYLRSTFRKSDGLAPWPKGLPPADDWALFTLLWKGILGGKELRVNFRMIRKDPHGTIRKVLSFLNVTRSDQDVDVAIASCSIESAKRAEQEFFRRKPSADRTPRVRAGLVGEALSAFEASDLDCLRGLPELAMAVMSGEERPERPVDIPFTGKHPGFALFDLGTRALSEGDRIKAREAFSAALSTAREEWEVLKISKSLMCCRWLEQIFGDDVDSNMACASLPILADLSGYLVDRPLHRFVYARELVRLQLPAAATKLVDPLELQSLMHYELIELGEISNMLGDRKRAKKAFQRAAETTPLPAESLSYARVLFQMGNYGASTAMLRSLEKAAWPKLLAQEALIKGQRVILSRISKRKHA